MLRKFFAVTIVSILLVTVNANAQQEKSESRPPDQPSLTRYEQFLKRTDAVIVTQSYLIADLPGGGGFKLAAQVAWALGEANKVYALDFSGRIVDFEQLKGMQEGLDKLVQALNSSFEKLNATSMSYSSPAGLSVSYYTYTPNNSPTPLKNLYMAVGSYVRQSPNVEPLMELRKVMAQARQKLISLGAK
jgi:hypothetical protein